MDWQYISSKSNNLVMRISKLKDKKYRKAECLFRFDGIKLFLEAIEKCVNIEYVFEISDDDASVLDLTSHENLLVLNVVNVPLNNPQASTMNLLSPILINYENKKTMQIILANSNYTTKKKLFEN